MFKPCSMPLAAGLAARTIVQCYAVMRSAFAHAVRLQLIAVNPADAVRPPRPGRPKLSVPSWDVVRAILDSTAGTHLHVPLVLLATTGMRRGEAVALQWSNCDLDAGVIRVTRAAQQVGQVVSFNDPKSDRGRRSIDLPASTVALLRQHRKEQLERRMLAGPEWSDGDLVIENGLGLPVRPDVLSRAFQRLVDRLGLHGIRLHDLRHAHATELLRAGVNVKVVSERLGHSGSSITLDVYASVLPGMQKVAASAIEAAMQ
jgi:integrase